jgi:hypothetical protein
VVKTFYQPHLIPKHLTGPEVPNWSSWANLLGALIESFLIKHVLNGLEERYEAHWVGNEHSLFTRFANQFSLVSDSGMVHAVVRDEEKRA